MLQFSEFVWTLRSSAWVVFTNFLLIDAADRSKINSDQNRLFFIKAYTPFHFSRVMPSSQRYPLNFHLGSNEYIRFSRIDRKKH